MMRQLVTMRHPIGFILFGALVAVVVQPAFGAIVGSRIQAEGMTESSSDIAVQDDGAGDEGDHLRFANSATGRAGWPFVQSSVRPRSAQAESRRPSVIAASLNQRWRGCTPEAAKSMPEIRARL